MTRAARYGLVACVLSTLMAVVVPIGLEEWRVMTIIWLPVLAAMFFYWYRRPAR